MFSAADVLSLYTQCEALGVTLWIDGGWGVDALLGEQTRPHADVDIAIQEKDLPALRALLEGQGYRDVPRDDTCAWNFVLGDDAGRLVDVHVIVLDAAGNGIYGPPENGEMYPASALTGSGSILGRAVRCIAPEDLVRFHTGYPLRPHDIADVSALCRRFNIPLPPEYARRVGDQKGD